ncbi:esterase/lipase family protein [Natronococcus occultus]|uniref:Alpha/beta hydrolase family protein n=1 Tax=Natronococcus occultus SP4 TaxID=694430 RepID=L0JV01_9EURY|nr:alpha/beta fold hydrolase [Natronococcus occultus]AGB36125.1 alpha/beta hydrolase family protein [Natronococcus occultus SP4]
MNGHRSSTATEDDNECEPHSTAVSRRQLLGATAGATAGVAGVGAVSDPAAASDRVGCDDWLEAPADYPEIDLTDAEPTASNLEEIGEEFVVFVHGWHGRETSTDQAATLREALDQNGYDRPVLAATWAADTYNYWRAERTTETVGERLAAWLEDVPDATVHLVGHSLGGRACLETLAVLETRVETVSLLGTAADDDAVCTAGAYGRGIEHGADAVYNYHSEDDASVCYGYDLQSFASGLGCAGSDCGGGWFRSGSSCPANYTDVDVTGEVGDHCAYTKPDVGCVDRIADVLE